MAIIYTNPIKACNTSVADPTVDSRVPNCIDLTHASQYTLRPLIAIASIPDCITVSSSLPLSASQQKTMRKNCP